MGYQSTINLVKDENLLADSHSTLNRYNYDLTQLLNVYRISGVRQIEIRTAEPLVTVPSPLEYGIAIAKLRKCKFPGSNKIPAELIQAGGEILHSKIHMIIYSIWNEKELPYRWAESIIVPIYKKGDKTDCGNYRGISLLSTSYRILSKSLSQS
jgi:hypothetical protein